MIFKNLLRKKVRLTLLLITTAIGFFLFGALSSIQSSFTGDGDRTNTNRLLVTNKINLTQPIPRSYLERVRQIDGVSAVTHSNWFGGYYRDPQNMVVSFAVDMKTYLDVYQEISLPDDQFQSCLSRPNALIVGQMVAGNFGWRVGQNVTIQSNIYQRSDGEEGWDFVVCGIFSDTEERGSDSGVLFHYKYFDEARTFGKGTVGLISLLTQDNQLNDRVAEAIDVLFVNSPAETETITEQQFAAAFAAQFGNIGLIVTLVVGAGFITILMVVGSTMVLTVHERGQEIAILKTLGFSQSLVLRLVIGECLAIICLGGLIGLGLATGVMHVLSQNGQMGSADVSLSIWANGVGWIFLLSILCGVAPAYVALRRSIASTLDQT